MSRTRTLVDPQPKPVKRPSLAERKAANKAAHAAALAQVRAEEKAKKQPKTKLVKPDQHPLMLPGNLEWDRPRVFAIICERVATTTDSLHSILAQGHEGMTLPSYFAVQRWLTIDEECAALYKTAKESQADVMGEQMLAIADDGRNDYMERFEKDGMTAGWVLNGEHVQRSKIRLDTRKWLMGKLKPKRYGEKFQVGGDPEGVPIQFKNVDLSTLTEAELLALKAARQKLLGSGDGS